MNDLLGTARYLSARIGGSSDADLARAASTIYYALFHELAKCCADTLVGADGPTRSHGAWRQIYRALDHHQTADKCAKVDIGQFPIEIQDFASHFRTMQSKRERCDYEFDPAVSCSEIEVDVEGADRVIAAFRTVPVAHRRAFAVYVLIKSERHNEKGAQFGRGGKR